MVAPCYNYCVSQVLVIKLELPINVNYLTLKISGPGQLDETLNKTPRLMLLTCTCGKSSREDLTLYVLGDARAGCKSISKRGGLFDTYRRLDISKRLLKLKAEEIEGAFSVDEVQAVELLEAG